MDKMPQFIRDRLTNAAIELFMQTYGTQTYGSHPPTRAQWLNLGSALAAKGVPLPEDWPRVIGGV